MACVIVAAFTLLLAAVILVLAWLTLSADQRALDARHGASAETGSTASVSSSAGTGSQYAEVLRLGAGGLPSARASMRQRRASYTMLNGVSVARRNRQAGPRTILPGAG